MALYGTTSGEPPRRALREQPTTRAAIHAMLRATADEITRPDTPHYCMLVLAAPTGAVENHAIREFLADLRRDMLATIKDRLARGVTDGDLTVPPMRPRRHRPLLRHRGAGPFRTGSRRRHPRRAGGGHHLRDGRMGHAHVRAVARRWVSLRHAEGGRVRISSWPRNDSMAGTPAVPSGWATRSAVSPVPGRPRCTRCSPTWRADGSPPLHALSASMSRAGRSSPSSKAGPSAPADRGRPGCTPRRRSTRWRAGRAATTRRSPTSSRHRTPSGAAAAVGRRA